MDRRNFLSGAAVAGLVPFGAANALIPQAYDVGMTDWGVRFNTLKEGQTELQRTGPMRSTPVPFAVVANAPGVVIAAQNPYRKGLLIKNLDPTDDLFIGFGTLADVNGFNLAPLNTVLFDFVCPTDTISVFATANIRGYLLEMAQIAD